MKRAIHILLFLTLATCSRATSPHDPASGANGSAGAPYSPTVAGSEGAVQNAYPPDGTTCQVTLDGSGSAPQTPPTAFTLHCAGCHGPTGTGGTAYDVVAPRQFPSIVGPRDYNALVDIVRNGETNAQGTMPMFDANHLDSNDLIRIYAFLTQSPMQESNVCSPLPAMTDAQIGDAYLRGMKAWRQTDNVVDPMGVQSHAACAYCHGPDALELAYLGFSDGDIMRRGSAHLAQADYEKIIDMVHALRAKYHIPLRDAASVRPLQPGGAVLPGATTADRDLAFGQQLLDMQLTLATTYINSTSLALRAENEMLATDQRALKVPMPVNHWSEDQFHNPPGYVPDCGADIDTCADHGTIADWIPMSPHVPSDPNTVFTAADQYLANPNQATLYAYLGNLPDINSMPGAFLNAKNMGIDDSKYRAIQIATHCMRLEVTGEPNCYQQGITPFPDHAYIWDVGLYVAAYNNGFSQSGCDQNWMSCPADLALPDFLFRDLTHGAKLSDNFQRMGSAWLTAWYATFDPTLMVTGDSTAQQDEYYQRSLFWENNDADYAGKGANPAYSIYSAWHITQRNVQLLHNPQVYACDKMPFSHPDLGQFPCTSVDIRSGYYPELTNFAEQKDFTNDLTYQIDFAPKDSARRGIYQMVGGNLYRLFLRKLIGELQNDNWMCRPDFQELRIARAKAFLSQPEIVAANGPADTEMFNTLAALMAKSQTNCPSFTP